MPDVFFFLTFGHLVPLKLLILIYVAEWMLWSQQCGVNSATQLLIPWNKALQSGKGKKRAETEEKIGKRSEPRLSHPVDVNLELRHSVKQMIESSEIFNSEFLTFVLHVFLWQN